MIYRISSPVPSSRYIAVHAESMVESSGTVHFQLSSWRPGRYELGNFAKNLRGMSASDEQGNPVPIYKTGASSWRVDNAPAGKLSLKYEYYAAQPDAGACWTDDSLLYVNPVHCLVFAPLQRHAPHCIELDIPSDWQVACGIPAEKHRIEAQDLDTLLDSPFFAARALHHRTYSVNDYVFHIWMYGQVQPDWDRILSDFQSFTRVQLEMMQYFPVPEYHFMLLMLPYRFYHGVEHTHSTVLALGPGYQLMHPALYTDLMGVASHELFHVWNVKTLRPADFLVYEYGRENYSRLGWVYEGFTTYYGDLFLARSGFFQASGFFAEINERLQRHADNHGKYFASVAESSFDTWLDGYVTGTPWRKTSIYDEGCLIALMLDLYIRRASRSRHSLDDLFTRLYADFALRHVGYHEQDIRQLAISFSDEGVQEILDTCVNRRSDYLPVLEDLLSTVGCCLQVQPSALLHESMFGFRTVSEGGSLKVQSVLPGSPAERAGLSKDDEVVACNGWKVEGNLSDLVRQSVEEEYSLTVFAQRKLRTIVMKHDARTYFDSVRIRQLEGPDAEARKAFTAWTGLEW